MTEAKKHELMLKTLKEVFGYHQFRGLQEGIIKNILNERNTFVIMPTGAGKSLCYQLPALLSDGLTIVISPLIALMKNQVDQMKALGVNAHFLNSTLTKSEITKVKKLALDSKIDLLYVAPESLTKDENVNFLNQVNIACVAVDEAHCISEWGHDFRPEYRRIREIISQIGDMPIIALTATATPKVQLDIQKNLNMEGVDLFKSSFNRINLFYEVKQKKDPKKQLITFLKNYKDKSGIIYCLSRKKVTEIAELLKVNGFNAAPYHAGLDASVREKNQDDFLNEDLKIVVATIAFGMGIDKPDVRFVIHYDVPKSLEGYYQETGRAGRDGLEGHCLMLYSHNDITKLEKFGKDKSVQERENARTLLQEMSFYAESPICRRKQLLHYFGETYEADNCSGCDNCTSPKEQFEGETYVEIILKAVLQTEERFGLTHLVNVILGVKNNYTESYEHTKLDVFGFNEGKDAEFWKSVIRQALIYQFLYKDIENVGVLKLSEKGKSFLKKPHSVTLAKNHEYTVGENDEKESSNLLIAKAYDEQLFKSLLSLRKKVAESKNLPPFVIFQDPSLEEMATTYPVTEEELAQINGVGLGKVKKFGSQFIKLIQKYIDDNDIITASNIIVKSSVNKSRMKIFIIQQIDKKIDLDEIAESKNISFENLLSEIENICYSGTRINLNYYIDEILEKSKQEDIIDYFLNAENDSLKEALEDEYNAEYSEEELRLMRIKFISEYAN